MNVLNLKWLLNSVVDLDRYPSLASPTPSQGFIEYVLKKRLSVLSRSVILQGTLVGHLMPVLMFKNLIKSDRMYLFFIVWLQMCVYVNILFCHQINKLG